MTYVFRLNRPELPGAQEIAMHCAGARRINSCAIQFEGWHSSGGGSVSDNETQYKRAPLVE
jgi:hypothetical protein